VSGVPDVQERARADYAVLAEALGILVRRGEPEQLTDALRDAMDFVHAEACRVPARELPDVSASASSGDALEKVSNSRVSSSRDRGLARPHNLEEDTTT